MNKKKAQPPSASPPHAPLQPAERQLSSSGHKKNKTMYLQKKNRVAFIACYFPFRSLHKQKSIADKEKETNPKSENLLLRLYS